MTRAKDRLILTPRGARDGDARGATRFLEEMGLYFTDQVRSTCQ